MGDWVQLGGIEIYPTPTSQQPSLNSILAIHLFRIDTSHRQAAMPQQALYVKQVHPVTN